MAGYLATIGMRSGLHAVGRIGAAVIGLCALTVEARADMVTDWNVIAFNTIPPSVQGPPQARVVGYIQAAVFDAVNSVERKYTPFAVDLKAPDASAEAAAASAAHGALIRFYPVQKTALDASLEKALAALPEGPAKQRGVELGKTVAERIHALSLEDGADATSPAYTPGKEPWSWQFTSPGMEPRGLTWGKIRPFLIKGADQFAFPGPLDVTNPEFAKEMEEVRMLGGANSVHRTADQTAAAIFWTVSMPAIYNDVARKASTRKGYSLIENARLLALLNMAASDSQIVTWAEKFNRSFLRPVTAIRAADKLGNRLIQPDPSWTSLLVTPAHPDYPSGHCAYAGAASRTLQLVLGEDEVDASYTFPPGVGVTRRWTRFSQMAQEVGEARIWGGIHTRTADAHADMIGRKVAEYGFANYMRPATQAAN